MIRIGWIGCGTHASEMVLPQLVRLPVNIVALCDVDAKRLGQIGDRYGVIPRYTDAGQLLADEELDAIGMGSVRRFMASWGPCPVTLREALHRRFHETLLDREPDCREHLAEWSFGSPASILGRFLLHHCVHAMELIPWMMGQPVTDVHARVHEIEPGKLVLHAGFGFKSGGLATVVMGTNQSRGTPMEWWQVMSDHQRLEIRNVHEVRYYRNPAFKADLPDATLDPQQDTLMWEPNLTAAANEDHKGYHALLSAFLAAVRGEPNDAPTIVDGVAAMRVLEALMRSMVSSQREVPDRSKPLSPQ